MLQRMDKLLPEWEEFESGLVQDMVGCAICGRVAYGGKHSALRRHFRLVDDTYDMYPNAAFSAPHLPFWDAERNGRPHWNVCGACYTGSARRTAQSRLHVPYEGNQEHYADLHLLMALPAGTILHLSVILCGVRLAWKYLGSLGADSMCAEGTQPLLKGPLLVPRMPEQYDKAAHGRVFDALERMTERLCETNPLVRRWLTAWERRIADDDRQDPSSAAEDCDDDCDAASDSSDASSNATSESSPAPSPAIPIETQAKHGLPIMSAAAMTGPAVAAQARNPLASLQTTQANAGMFAALDTEQFNPPPSERPAKPRTRGRRGNNIFFLGTTQRRQAVRLRAGAAAPKQQYCNGSGNSNNDIPFSPEAALFPALFPNNTGTFQEGKSSQGAGMSLYLQQRMHQMFQVYTLFPEYALTMIQVRAQGCPAFDNYIPLLKALQSHN